jgi:putative membrane protein insertion efficiency factor
MVTFAVMLKIVRTIFIIPIKLYKWLISPLLPMACRHVPTCSEYAMQAIMVHGIFKGTWLAVKRIARCHPWGTHGYDPVPEKKINTKKLKVD